MGSDARVYTRQTFGVRLMNLINVKLTYDERYEFIKLYDILRDMDFELSEKQQSVFEKIEEQS